MSKSRGNGVDPLEMIDRYGADALRFVMGYVATGGQDIRWDERRVEMGRNYANKLWNAARFAMLNLQGEDVAAEPAPERLADRWILSRLSRTITEVTEDLEAYDLGAATRKLYDFAWSEFCDWYLEAAKPALQAGDAATRTTLKYVLEAILKLQHPLMPYVTSELYRALGHVEQVALADWPAARPEHLDTAAEREFGTCRPRGRRAHAAVGRGRRPPPLEVHFGRAGCGLQAAPSCSALARARIAAVASPALTRRCPNWRSPAAQRVRWTWRSTWRASARLAKLEAEHGVRKKLSNEVRGHPGRGGGGGEAPPGGGRRRDGACKGLWSNSEVAADEYARGDAELDVHLSLEEFEDVARRAGG